MTAWDALIRQYHAAMSLEDVLGRGCAGGR